MRAKRRIAGKLDFGAYLIVAAFAIFFAAYFAVPVLFTASYQEMIVSLAYFIVLSYLTGYSLTKDYFKTGDMVELVSMRIGLGISALPLLFILMESAHAPLRWYIPLVLSAIRPAYDLLMREEMPRLGKARLRAFKPDTYSAAAVLIFVIAFSLALVGSYRYAYLEDGDPWEHAAGVKYVSTQGTYTPPQGVYVAHYLKPYPPAYDALLGLINQLNGSVSWTLKAFNSLLVGLTYLFAYFTVKRVTGDAKAGILAAAILFMLPSFGSHSIWAHTLSALVLFPVFYAADRIREDRSWGVLTAIILASSLLIQPLMSAIMGIFYAVFLLARAYADRREIKTLVAVGAAGLALSMVYWVPVLLESENHDSEMADIGKSILEGSTKVGVDPLKLPTMAQILFPESHGDLFMHEGLGIFAVILALLCMDLALRRGALRFAKDNPFLAAAFGWLIITSFALLSGNMSFSIHPTRFWGIVAIPLAIVSGYMLAHVGDLRWIRKKHAKYVVAAFLGGLVLFSLVPKAQVQLSVWPTDLQAELGENYIDYLRVLGVPQNTQVYTYCLPDKFVIGLDRSSLPWDKEIVDSRKIGYDIDPKKLHTLLKSRGYEWALFDSSCIRHCYMEANRTEAECQKGFAKNLKSLEDSKLFATSWRTKALIAFRVN
ncbi:MAG: glycosyltransferase family 39 protein [Candidatus Altiarchaeota archaeon]